ncbi:ABC transporter ATP-binding protein [Ghiorsea bivora]|uniref:ABC transporter ATP-binding protein n=1 Tax=Ghiorsea bivora TaxID=1485545 RepID=UPI00056DCE17|nr:ABC transporter ATP-binding protein [Ghiorsea bivora]
MNQSSAVGINVDNLSVTFMRHAGLASSFRETLNRILRREQVGPKSFLALDHVNFSASEGERVAIVGHNGAGKSTLLKCIAGIYPPTEGMIEVNGMMIPLLELGAGFSMAMSVRENIYLNGAILGLPKEKVQELEGDILAFSELGNFSDQPMISLSSGMRSRLGFSVASFLNPEILLLDEVFATGDVAFVKKAKAKMEEMIDNCKIVLMVSHQESIIRDVCNRMVVMDHGKIVKDTSIDEGYEFYHKLINV